MTNERTDMPRLFNVLTERTRILIREENVAQLSTHAREHRLPRDRAWAYAQALHESCKYDRPIAFRALDGTVRVLKPKLVDEAGMPLEGHPDFESFCEWQDSIVQAEIDAENAYVRYEENRYVPGEFGDNGEGW